MLSLPLSKWKCFERSQFIDGPLNVGSIANHNTSPSPVESGIYSQAGRNAPHLFIWPGIISQSGVRHLQPFPSWPLGTTSHAGRRHHQPSLKKLGGTISQASQGTTSLPTIGHLASAATPAKGSTSLELCCWLASSATPASGITSLPGRVASSAAWPKAPPAFTLPPGWHQQPPRSWASPALAPRPGLASPAWPCLDLSLVCFFVFEYASMCRQSL